MSRPMLELLERARCSEASYYGGHCTISVADYESALRAQRDEWLRLDTEAIGEKASVKHKYKTPRERCAADIDPDGKP